METPYDLFKVCENTSTKKMLHEGKMCYIQSKNKIFYFDWLIFKILVGLIPRQI